MASREEWFYFKTVTLTLESKVKVTDDSRKGKPSAESLMKAQCCVDSYLLSLALKKKKKFMP